jgi:hypothetical protein
MMLIPMTALLLIVVPMAFNASFFLLQRSFAYPDILREPTEIILRQFYQGGAPLRRLWYAFTLSALLFTPAPVLLQQVFGPDAPWFLLAGTVIGVLAGVVQTLGLIRWYDQRHQLYPVVHLVDCLWDCLAANIKPQPYKIRRTLL